MLRRLVLCALATVALAALEGCGVDRLTGPAGDGSNRHARQLGDHPRTDPGLPGPGEEFGWRGADAPATSADTLRTGGGDGEDGRPRTD